MRFSASAAEWINRSPAKKITKRSTMAPCPPRKYLMNSISDPYRTLAANLAGVGGTRLLNFRSNGGLARSQPRTLAPSAGAAATPLSLMAKADDMHGALIRRADALAGSTEGPDDEAEVKAIVDAIEAYEQKCWPQGRTRACWEGRAPVPAQGSRLKS
jgi:hypothetical protein